MTNACKWLAIQFDYHKQTLDVASYPLQETEMRRPVPGAGLIRALAQARAFILPLRLTFCVLRFASLAPLSPR
jgi:hypothetical protein